MRFPAKITSSCIWVSIPVDWVILHWFACGANGSAGLCTYGHVITNFFRMGRLLHFLTHDGYATHSSLARAALRNTQLEFAEYCRVLNPNSRWQNRKQMKFSIKKFDSRKQTFAAQPRAYGSFLKTGRTCYGYMKLFRRAQFTADREVCSSTNLRLPPLIPLRSCWFFFWRPLSYDALRGSLTVLCTSLVRLAL